MDISQRISILVLNEEKEINLQLSHFFKNTIYDVFFSEQTDNLNRIIKTLNPELILCNISHNGLKNGTFLEFRNLENFPLILWGVNSKSETTDFSKIKLIDCINDIEDLDEVMFRVKNIISLKSSIIDSVDTKDQIEKLQKDKNELIGIAAHDLKNPIYSISMLAKVLRDDKTLTREDITEFSNDIITTSERMLELIKQLLDLNAIEEGKLKINPENFDLIELIQNALDVYIEIAGHKSIKISASYNSKDSIVFTDRVATLQVLDNLVSNAIKFSPIGKTILINITDSVTHVSFEVKDEGPGLTDEDKTKLFQKFARLSAQPTAGENSTGLGLSIVKKVVEAMNGKIEVISIPGEGSSFIVSLPKI